MKYMEDLKELLCAELEDYAEKGKKSGKLSLGDVSLIDTMLHSVKNIQRIEMMEEGGYSEDGGWEARGMYRDGVSYNEGGSSYARRKRDSMGRYSRDGGYSEDGRGNRGGMGRYSRDGGKDHMIEMAEELMENASGKEKETYRRIVSMLESV